MRPTLAISMVLLTMSMAACSERVRAGRTAAPAANAVAPAVKDPAAERAATREKLAALRQLQIQRLHDYTVAGQFPINEVSQGYLNVFVDAAGRLCAVANLIHLSGGDDLVAKTARENNYIALRDVHDGPLMDWVLRSGLTHEEVVLIQGIGYEPVAFELDRGEQQIQRLRDRLQHAEAQLIADTEKSLDVAVARLVVPATPRKDPGSRVALVEPPVAFGNADGRTDSLTPWNRRSSPVVRPLLTSTHHANKTGWVVGSAGRVQR